MYVQQTKQKYVGIDHHLVCKDCLTLGVTIMFMMT